jgi:hypothetical protein
MTAEGMVGAPTCFILMVLASCGHKYYRTNFISAVPTALLIAPGLRTIQFLFTFFMRFFAIFSFFAISG